jgi:uncharacterized repeat protein (TIGR02543 family)
MIIFCLSVVFPFSMQTASALSSGDYFYKVNSDLTVTITGYFGNGGNITIPAAIDSKPVTGIGQYAFLACDNLTGVTVPNSVTTLDNYAFDNCPDLKIINLGSGAYYISLYYSIYDCPSLEQINVSTGNEHYASQDGVLFNKGKTAMYKFPHAKAGSYTIPNGVASLGSIAFSGCTKLTTLNIGSDLTSTEDNFHTCSALTQITVTDGNPNFSSQDGVLFNKDKSTLICYPAGRAGSYIIPDGVATIKAAFRNCTNLTGVTIPDSVTNIDYAFDHCTKLNGVILPDSVTKIAGSFDHCTALTSITIPALVTDILDNAFHDCTGLTSIILPDSVTTIGVQAFQNCTGLTSVTFGSGVKDVQSSAFEYCSNLTSIILPDSVYNIAEYAFAYCTKLKSVSIGNVQTYINYGNTDNPFIGCTALEQITVGPDNSQSASVDGVLFNKSKTTLLCCPGGKKGNYDIPDGVTSIGEYAFDSCGKLARVTLPDGIATIGTWAFINCTGPVSVIFPDSVTSLEGQAFFNCTRLKAAYFYGNAPSIMSGTFNNSASGFKVYYLSGKTGFTGSGWSSFTKETFTPDGKIAEALALLPASITVYEGNTSNLLEDLYAITGATGTELTLTSANANVADNGDITYTGYPVAGDVVVHIHMPGGTEATKTIPVNVSNYTVKFDTHGGSVVNNIQADKDTKITAPVVPTKTGYTFEGWYKEDSLTTPWLFDTDTVSGNRTLHAKWTANDYYVTYDAQGGTVSPAGKTVTYGQTYGALPTPSRAGYNFGGWYTQANGAGTHITSASVVGTAAAHKLYAKWTAAVKYTITTTVSNTSYGSAKGAGSYYKDTKCTLTAIPKSGCCFTQWTEGTATASTSAVYGFTVTKARTLKANFATIGTPKLSSAASAGYASIKLTWTSVSGAKGYEVYRATSSGGKYAKVKTVAGVTSATDTVPKTGTTYYYKVKAYCVAGSTTTTGGLSSVKSAKAVPAKAAGLTLSKASATSIKISYSAVAGATKYEICRATSKTGKYTVVQTTAALAYTNTSLVKGKTYYYKVRAYHLEGTTKVYGDYSDIKSLKL